MAAKKQKPGDRKSFPLRLDPNVHQAIKAWAEQDMRSVNGQIEFLLREALRRRKGGGGERKKR